MKRILIALLLGITLVSCGAKRKVDYISVSDYSMGDYFFEERGYNKAEVMELIKKDIEKADTMYEDYDNLIKTDDYIIIYTVLEVDGNNYKVWIHDVQHGDKEYIDNSYEITKDIYDEVFGK